MSERRDLRKEEKYARAKADAFEKTGAPVFASYMRLAADGVRKQREVRAKHARSRKSK